MNARKTPNYFPAGQLLAILLLLAITVPAGAFPQNGGSGTEGSAPPLNAVHVETVTGKVVETMMGGGYTYALVDKEGVQTWVALPKAKLMVGDEIACHAGMVMDNFRSSSLNRTFEHIVFAGGLASHTGPGADAAAKEENAPLPKTQEVKDWNKF